MSDKQRNKLIAHILALSLIVDKFCVRFEELCKDTGVKSRILADTYRSMGCAVNKLKGDKEKGQLVAVMKLPVKLPPVVLRKGGKKRE